MTTTATTFAFFCGNRVVQIIIGSTVISSMLVPLWLEPSHPIGKLPDTNVLLSPETAIHPGRICSSGPNDRAARG
jgi:hypothetical protein